MKLIENIINNKKDFVPKRTRPISYGINFKKIRVFYFLLVFILLLSFFLSPNLIYATAGVPALINFQGRLMDSSGNLLGSSSGTDYCYKFSIYNATTAGSKIWPTGDPSTDTIVTRLGVFDASIGNVDTLDLAFTDDQAFVDVQVATKVGASCTTGADEVFETLTPRPRIVSSGFAINSKTVGGFTPAQSATDSQIPVLTTGGILLNHATTARFASVGTAPLAVDAGSSGILNLNNTSTGNILLGGGSGSTGCTLTNSTGAFACTAGLSGSGLTLTSSNTTEVTTASAVAINVNSLTSGTGLYAASSSLTSGKLVDLQVSGTAAAASQTVLNILTAGATATNAITTYGGQISNTHTNATSGTNVALYLNASGATTANYGLIVNAGDVGIGTTTPTSPLHIVKTNSTADISYAGQTIAITDSGTHAAGDENRRGLSSNITTSGNFTSSGGRILSIQGGQTSATYSGTVSTGGDANELRVVGTDANATFSGTMSAAGDLVNVYGIYANGNGNIGTTGSTSHYGGFFTATDTADVNYGIYANVSGATTNYAGIFTGGNVGVGDTSPTGLLTLSGGNIILEEGNTGREITFAGGRGRICLYCEVAGNDLNITVSNGRAIQFHTDAALTGDPASLDMIIGATGLVGMGDATPDQKLEVMSSSATSTQLTVSNSSTGDPQLAFELSDGTNAYTMGIDNSVTGDPFKISTTALGTGDFFTIDPRTTTSAVSAITLATGVAPTIASGASTYFNSTTFTPGTVNFSGSTQITSTGTSANNATLFNQPTINRTDAASSLVIDQASNLFINGATIATHATVGQTETITAASALRIGAGSTLAGTRGVVTSGYGLYVDPPTGATNNYAAVFSSGNVGIGTTNPLYHLQVKGAATGGIISLLSSDTSGSEVQIYANGAFGGVISVVDSNPLLFQTNNTERARITSGGDLMIGTDGTNTAANIGGTGLLAYGAICADDSLDTADDCIDAARNAGTVYGIASSFTIDDIAENFPTTDASITSGHIVALDYLPAPEGSEGTDHYETEFVSKVNLGVTSKVLGVISTKPGVLLGGWGQNKDPRSVQEVPVALSGRVPVKVTEENGAIEPGDYITASLTEAGYGMKMTESGESVGIALESSVGKDEVLVFINLGFKFVLDDGSPSENNVPEAQSFLGRLFNKISNWFSDAGNGIVDFFANRVHTKELCVSDDSGETCITKSQLDNLLDGNGKDTIINPTQDPMPTPEPNPSTGSGPSAQNPTPDPEMTPPEPTPTPEPAPSPDPTPTPDPTL